MKHLFVTLLFIFSSLILSANNQLKDFKIGGGDGAFEAIYRFAKPIKRNQINIEYINRTIQLNIQDISFDLGKQLTPIGREDIKSLYTYQVKKDLLRSRIIYNEPFKAADFEGFVDIIVDGKEVVIKILNPNIDIPIILPVKVAELDVQPSDIGDVMATPISVKKTEEINQKNKDKVSIEKMEAEALGLIKADKKNSKKLTKSKTSKSNKKENKKTSLKDRIENGIQASKDLPESSIPVFVSKVKKSKPTEAMYARVFYTIGILLALGIGVFFFIRNMTKKNKTTIDNKKIKVLQQHHLGPKKSLTMVSVAGETILLGVTDQNINFIKSISLIDDEYATEYPKNFKSEMEKELNHKMDKVIDKSFVSSKAKENNFKENSAKNHTSKQSFTAEIDDEFSVNKITHLVQSKLKNMRQF